MEGIFGGLSEEEWDDLQEEADDSWTQEEIDKYNRRRPVIVTDDCRDDEDFGPTGNLSNFKGVLLGVYGYTEDFTRLTELRKLKNRFQLQGMNRIRGPNPLIYVPQAMEYIWGLECYWEEWEGLPKVAKSVASMLEDRAVEEKGLGKIDWDKMFS